MTPLRARARGNHGIAWLACLVVAGVAAPAAAQTAAPVKKGTVERIMVHGASLAGNLEGDSPARDVFVYLPPSYATSRNQRYPVVYLLHGYGLTAERWMTFTNLAEAADKTIAAGTLKEMILVSPDAFTKHSGSMYSSSPTTGDWESYIAEDLVSYIDSHYRTIANRMSRGLGGHSMGGYGTIRIGMKRPDVFSSLDVMSACCLMQNAAPAQGNRGARAAAPPPDRSGEPAAAGRGNGGRGAGAGQGRGRGGFGNVQAALAAAWSPNPKNPPDFFDMPVKDGEPQPLVIAKWAANAPLAMIDQYVTNLKKYKAITIEVGTLDGLAASNRQMDQILSDFGVAHTFETYEGDHTNRVVERIETKVLPFFSSNLSFTAPRR
ncbi:MAG TPA: alpha/beta fold hydrolase [Vicinamibacterales bacterium]|nr:alpha/beta fold hydrolase [Vicinamibacterales bacterium]